VALDLGRWFRYAQAKLNDAVRSGNAELDRREAEREVELADRPWLGADDEVPTFDEARARIERTAEDAARGGAPEDRDDPPATLEGPRPPSSGTDAEVAAARLELERRGEEARARLDAIRAELDGDPPAPGSP